MVFLLHLNLLTSLDVLVDVLTKDNPQNKLTDSNRNTVIYWAVFLNGKHIFFSGGK